MISIPDVPDGSAAWLVRLLRSLAGAPPWTGGVLELAGELALLLVLVVWLRLWARARTAGTRAVVTALAVPAGAVLTWPVNELAKQVLHAGRPCRLLPEFPDWALCPAPGDWSFPSNHAAIAGALAVGVLLLARRVRAPVAAAFALLAALTASASRVLAGAHFPHDVVAGFALGGMVSVVTVTLIGRHAVPVVGRLRAGQRIPVLLGREDHW